MHKCNVSGKMRMHVSSKQCAVLTISSVLCLALSFKFSWVTTLPLFVILDQYGVTDRSRFWIWIFISVLFDLYVWLPLGLHALLFFSVLYLSSKEWFKIYRYVFYGALEGVLLFYTHGACDGLLYLIVLYSFLTFFMDKGFFSKTIS